MSVCPWDGCDYESSDLGVKQHHKRTHGESLSTVTAMCEFCGEEYERQQSNKGGGSYCSQECYKKDDRERVLVTCAECGSDVEKWPSEVSDTENFCSRQCKGHHDRADPNTQCSWCEAPIHKPQSKLENHEDVYCSSDCRDKHMMTDKHPRWREGKYNIYVSGWGSSRKEALQRDQYRCQSCGMNDADHREEYGRQLDVHHIQPIRTFDEPSNAHTLDNLITLCRLCHSKIENESKRTV